MKHFFKIFFILLIIQIIIGFTNLLNSNLPEIIQQIFHLLNVLISLPLSMIDRTYPFYALGSLSFQIFLFVLNLSLQTLIIFLISKGINLKSRIKEKN